MSRWWLGRLLLAQVWTWWIQIAEHWSRHPNNCEFMKKENESSEFFFLLLQFNSNTVSTGRRKIRIFFLLKNSKTCGLIIKWKFFFSFRVGSSLSSKRSWMKRNETRVNSLEKFNYISFCYLWIIARAQSTRWCCVFFVGFRFTCGPHSPGEFLLLLGPDMISFETFRLFSWYIISSRRIISNSDEMLRRWSKWNGEFPLVLL